MWGATIPTKAIGPTTATTELVAKMPIPIPIYLYKTTLRPRELAVSSPNCIISIFLEMISEKARQTKTKGRANLTPRQEFWTRDPAPHKNRPLLSCSNKSCRAEVIEENTLELI